MDIVHAYKIFRVVSQQQRTKELTRALVAHMAIEGRISYGISVEVRNVFLTSFFSVLPMFKLWS